MTSVMVEPIQAVGESTIRGYVSRQVWHPNLLASQASATVADVEVSESGEHVLVMGDGARCGVGDAVLLPKVGQDVRLEDGGAIILGHFLGILGRVDQGVGARLRGSVLTASGMQTVALPPVAWQVPVEARGGGFTGVDVDAAVRALAEVHIGAEKAAQGYEAWKARTVARAHEYADDNDLCSRFDDFMEEVGLPSRRRSENVSVEVTVNVEVEVELGRHDDAVDFITDQMVREELDRRVAEGCYVEWEVC